MKEGSVQKKHGQKKNILRVKASRDLFLEGRNRGECLIRGDRLLVYEVAKDPWGVESENVQGGGQ